MLSKSEIKVDLIRLLDTEFRYLNSHWISDYNSSIDVDTAIREFINNTLEDWGYKYFEDSLEKFPFSQSLQLLKLVEVGVTNQNN